MSDQGTRLETDEEVRNALERYRSPRRTKTPLQTTTVIEECPPHFRPTVRPPTPVLIVCDDGSEDGEKIRIRKDQFVIGRTEGDLTIGNDAQISSRHAELRQSRVHDKYRWTLVDLQSTNGTYVRVGQAVLDHGQEFLIGGTRFRFENPSPVESGATEKKRSPDQSTRAWPGSAPAGGLVFLIELSSYGDGPRYSLDEREIWIGRDAEHCRATVSNDSLVNDRHARIRRIPEGRWSLENNKSVNGIWLRVEQITFGGACRFMLGEQKFTFRVPQS